MKAVYIRKTGDVSVLEIGERPKPSPGPNDVLIRVRAASVNPRDWLVREGRYPFQITLRMPIILGSDAAGEVAAVGASVRDFAVGDRVFTCQTALGQMGAYAEYMRVRVSAVAKIPENLSFEQAAAVPLGALTSWRALQTNGCIRAGMRVLVIGGSGSCGRWGVQLAKAWGTNVTAVCGTDNVEMVTELGADCVMDYRQASIHDCGETFDLIYDTIGKEGFARCKHLLTRKGRYVTTLPRPSFLGDWVRSHLTPGPTAHCVLVRADGRILCEVAQGLTTSRWRDVIDRVYPLEQVAEAHTYSRGLHTKGKLILRVG